MAKRRKNPNAVILGKLSGMKRGLTQPDAKLRWLLATKRHRAAAAIGRLGGLKGGTACAAALSQKQKSAIGKKAARARWNKTKKSAVENLPGMTEMT
jgi:hypothetical protein